MRVRRLTCTQKIRFAVFNASPALTAPLTGSCWRRETKVVVYGTG
jgi:hypothetical protein